MSIFDLIFPAREKKRRAADIAKERLQIVVAHRTQQKDPDFLQKLHAELIEVIKKYVKTDTDQIKVQLEQTDDTAILELNVTLPNTLKSSQKSKKKKEKAKKEVAES